MVSQAHLAQRDVDYLIMTNAHEESRLAELLVDLRQSFPGLSEVEARQRLRPRLLQLLAQKKIGIYSIDTAPSQHVEPQQCEMDLSKAKDLVEDDHAWAWTPPEGGPLYCLFPIDLAWWGEGGTETVKA